MSVRDEIADILNEPDIEWDIVPDYDDAGNEIGERLDPYLTDVVRDGLAERIIALIRDRLLSGEAIRATGAAIHELEQGSLDYAMTIAEVAIFTALDAITGEQP